MGGSEWAPLGVDYVQPRPAPAPAPVDHADAIYALYRKQKPDDSDRSDYRRLVKRSVTDAPSHRFLTDAIAAKGPSPAARKQGMHCLDWWAQQDSNL